MTGHTSTYRTEGGGVFMGHPGSWVGHWIECECGYSTREFLEPDPAQLEYLDHILIASQVGGE